MSRIIRAGLRAAVILCVCLLNGCNGKGPVDFEALNKRAAKDYLTPVRPGIPGGQPFWNVYSTKFTFAPAFDFPEASGADRYRFDLWYLDNLWREIYLPVPEKRPTAEAQLEKYSATSEPTASFTATSPKADLSPVWGTLPEGYYGLVVTAVDATGQDITPVGTWEFLRDFPFCGPYPEPVRSYRDAALMALWFNHRTPLVRKIHDWDPGTPYETENVFANKFIGSVICSEVLMAREIPTYRDECLENARKAADLLISLAQREGTPLAHFPPTYYDSRILAGKARNDTKIGGTTVSDLQEMTMTLDALHAVRGYLDLYDFCGERKYFDEAVAVLQTYDRIVDSTGFMPKKLYLKTGEGVNGAGALSGNLLMVIRRLRKQYGIRDFDGLADRCESWMNENAIRNFHMSAQFEDVSIDQHPYQNLTNITPDVYARYLLEKEDFTSEDLAVATDLLHFVEDQFIHWDLPRNADGMFYCNVPGVYEQYSCRISIDSSNDAYINAALGMFDRTGDRLWYEKARALMNTVVNSQAVTGEIPTFMGLEYGAPNRYFWINCSLRSAQTLLRFAEYEERLD